LLPEFGAAAAYFQMTVLVYQDQGGLMMLRAAKRLDHLLNILRYFHLTKTLGTSLYLTTNQEVYGFKLVLNRCWFGD